VAMQPYNSSSLEAEAEDLKFKISLFYIARLFFKKYNKKLTSTED
jgi:hypothetical protein